MENAIESSDNVLLPGWMSGASLILPISGTCFSREQTIRQQRFFYSGFHKTVQTNPLVILTYAPFAMNQMSRHGQSDKRKKKLWTVFVNADEMREIPLQGCCFRKEFPMENGNVGNIAG